MLAVIMKTEQLLKKLVAINKISPSAVEKKVLRWEIIENLGLTVDVCTMKIVAAVVETGKRWG